MRKFATNAYFEKASTCFKYKDLINTRYDIIRVNLKNYSELRQKVEDLKIEEKKLKERNTEAYTPILNSGLLEIRAGNDHLLYAFIVDNDNVFVDIYQTNRAGWMPLTRAKEYTKLAMMSRNCHQKSRVTKWACIDTPNIVIGMSLNGKPFTEQELYKLGFEEKINAMQAIDYTRGKLEEVLEKKIREALSIFDAVIYYINTIAYIGVMNRERKVVEVKDRSILDKDKEDNKKESVVKKENKVIEIDLTEASKKKIVKRFGSTIHRKYECRDIEWGVRGHWRQYKSGKKIFIKPQQRTHKKSKAEDIKRIQKEYKI